MSTWGALGLGGAPGILLGFLAPALQADLELSRAAVGVLIGCFYGATGLGATVGGALAERLGARVAVAVDLVASAACLLLAGLVPTYPTVALAAVVSGFGYAMTNAATNMAVATVLPPERHGPALAVRTAGVPLVAVLAASVSAGLAERLGWPAVVLGTVPILVLAGLTALVVLPEARSPAAADGGRGPAAGGRRLVRGGGPAAHQRVPGALLVGRVLPWSRRTGWVWARPA